MALNDLIMFFLVIILYILISTCNSKTPQIIYKNKYLFPYCYKVPQNMLDIWKSIIDSLELKYLMNKLIFI